MKIIKKLSDKVNILFLAVVYAYDVLFMAIHGKQLLDSDMASEMVLSDLLNKEKSLTGLTTNWFYSTELRFLQTQWFYRVGLALSPNDWHAARTIAVALMLFLLAISVWCLLYACDKKT